ncbi:hypothetical protein [Sphingomonas sp. 8AM]|uniref:hypothetical protein n=1 Tax=Sphingomonas sp. 8AM TaxID=2653170 RepID=UPI0013582C6A|nr:hypothetical protein [Sphingomonas sp. 8AM]
MLGNSMFLAQAKTNAGTTHWRRRSLAQEDDSSIDQGSLDRFDRGLLNLLATLEALDCGNAQPRCGYEISSGPAEQDAGGATLFGCYHADTFSIK